MRFRIQVHLDKNGYMAVNGERLVHVRCMWKNRKGVMKFHRDALKSQMSFYGLELPRGIKPGSSWEATVEAQLHIEEIPDPLLKDGDCVEATDWDKLEEGERFVIFLGCGYECIPVTRETEGGKRAPNAVANLSICPSTCVKNAGHRRSEMTVTELAANLESRTYPDVTMVALSDLERLETCWGVGTPHWGHGPHHLELSKLGLCTIADPGPSGAYQVRLTELGREVVETVYERQGRRDSYDAMWEAMLANEKAANESLEAYFERISPWPETGGIKDTDAYLRGWKAGMRTAFDANYNAG